MASPSSFLPRFLCAHLLNDMVIHSLSKYTQISAFTQSMRIIILLLPCQPFSARHLPLYPETQVLNSATFRKPPLDGSLNLAQLYDWQGEHSPDHPLLLYPREVDDSIRTIYFQEGSEAVRRGAKVVRERVADVRKTTKRKVPLVAVVSAVDTVTYFISFVAVQRADCSIFLISPRNSARAVAHLLNKEKADHVLVGNEPASQALVEEAFQLLRDSDRATSIPGHSPMLTYDMLFDSAEPSPAPEDLPLTNAGLADVAIYFHSSGSTSFPKPIPISNKHFLEHVASAHFGDRDLCGKVLGLQAMPIYHVIGAMRTTQAATIGLVLSTLEPRAPAIVPTPENVMAAAIKTKTDLMFCVATFLETWAKMPKAVEWLASIEALLYGGGPLNKGAGDYLVSQGVKLFTSYGLTEVGAMPKFLPDKPSLDWRCIEFAPCIRKEMRHAYDDLYELVVVAGPLNVPAVINTTSSDGVPAYATSDLLVEHPEQKGYWRIYGRTDDQIMHSTGEKTNPGPLESMLKQDPHVQSCVMFGRGRFQAGILVDPKVEFKFDPGDEEKLVAFRNKIWPTIEQMNEFAPQHSRIFKEMILVSKPSKPFQYTVKNTPRRQAIIADYDDEINALYDAVDESAQAGIQPPSEWDEESTAKFVRAVVAKVLKHNLPDDVDLFQHGCDSLQATWIRNTLLRAVRDAAELDTRGHTDNFVYTHPTVQSLSRYVYDLVSGSTTGPASDEDKIKAMHAMVDKYTAKFLSLSESNPKADEKVVLLTGTTGGLGCHALGVLIGDPSVKRIFALNRNGTKDLRARQIEAFVERGIDDMVSALERGKVMLIEGDTASADLGINEQTFDEMKGSITHIVHNAWRVDFNLGLASFESNVKGVRNLIDLALHAGARFLFISSVGIFQNAPADHPLTETPIEPSVAIGSGYTQSKWVSEQILQTASQQTGLSYMNTRMGQLCGGTNGSWTVRDWLPTLVQSATVFGCLPTDERTVSWIPNHIAAQAVVDYLDTPNDLRITHVVHPRPVKWSQLAEIISRCLDVSIVSYDDWLAKLLDYASSKDLDVDLTSRLPALRLLPFYRGVQVRNAKLNRDAFGIPRLDFNNAVSGSKALRVAVSLDEQHVKAWLKYWTKCGFLSG